MARDPNNPPDIDKLRLESQRPVVNLPPIPRVGGVSLPSLPDLANAPPPSAAGVRGGAQFTPSDSDARTANYLRGIAALSGGSLQGGAPPISRVRSTRGREPTADVSTGTDADRITQQSRDNIRRNFRAQRDEHQAVSRALQDDDFVRSAGGAAVYTTVNPDGTRTYSDRSSPAATRRVFGALGFDVNEGADFERVYGDSAMRNLLRERDVVDRRMAPQRAAAEAEARRFNAEVGGMEARAALANAQAARAEAQAGQTVEQTERTGTLNQIEDAERAQRIALERADFGRQEADGRYEQLLSRLDGNPQAADSLARRQGFSNARAMTDVETFLDLANRLPRGGEGRALMEEQLLQSGLAETASVELGRMISQRMNERSTMNLLNAPGGIVGRLLNSNEMRLPLDRRDMPTSGRYVPGTASAGTTDGTFGLFRRPVVRIGEGEEQRAFNIDRSDPTDQQMIRLLETLNRIQTRNAE